MSSPPPSTSSYLLRILGEAQGTAAILASAPSKPGDGMVEAVIFDVKKSKIPAAIAKLELDLKESFRCHAIHQDARS